MANRPLSFGLSGDENFDEMIVYAADTIKSGINAHANDTFPNISTANLLFKLGETNLFQVWISNKRFDRWNSANEYLINISIGQNIEAYWYAEDQLRNIFEPTKTFLSNKIARFNQLLRTFGVQLEKDADYSYPEVPLSIMPDFFLKDTQNYQESCDMVVDHIRQQDRFAPQEEEEDEEEVEIIF